MSGSRASTDSQTSSNTTTQNTDNSQQLGVDGSGNLLVGSGANVAITNNDLSGEGLEAIIRAGDSAFSEARRLGTDSLAVGERISANATALASDALTRLVEGQTEASSLSRYVVNQGAQTSQAALEALQKGNSDALTRQLEAQNDALSFGRYVAGTSAAASQAAIEALAKGNSDALTRMLESQTESLSTVRYSVGRSADLSEAALTSANRSVYTVAKTLSEAQAGNNSLLYKMITANQELTNSARAGDAALAEKVIDRAITGISDSRRDTNEKILTDGFKYAAWAVGAIAVGFVGFAIFRRAK